MLHTQQDQSTENNKELALTSHKNQQPFSLLEWTAYANQVSLLVFLFRLFTDASPAYSGRLPQGTFLTTSGIVGKHACHLSVDTEDSKNITSLATCPAACSALVDGCKGTVHARCCRCLATSAAFTAKVAAWPTTQSKRKWAPADHLPEGEQSEYTETFFTCNLTLTKNNGQRDVQRHEGK